MEYMRKKISGFKSVVASISALILIVLLGVNSMATSSEIERHSVQPENGFVPDEHTAIQIGKAVLVPIYGEEQIESEKPFKAVLKNEIWYVEGSLPKSKFEKGIVKGGVAIVEISKKDGRILRVSHGR